MARKDFKCLDKIEKMPMLRVAGPIVYMSLCILCTYSIQPHWIDMLLRKRQNMFYGRFSKIKLYFYMRV
jgi:hypothetical protein